MIRRNLPPDSDPWGAAIDKRISDLSTKIANLNTLVTSTNSRVGSLLETQKNMAVVQAASQVIEAGLVTAQAEIQVTQVAQTAQVEFLLGQTEIDEANPPDLTVISPTVDTPETWLPYDPDCDATVTIMAPASGQFAAQCSGYLAAYVTEFSSVRCFIGAEVLDHEGDVVSLAYIGDGNILELWGDNVFLNQVTAGQVHLWSGYVPGETYTLRIRRGYNVIRGSGTAATDVYFQGTGISITKIGM